MLGDLDFLDIRTVKLGEKELFDKEQIGVKDPFPVTNLPIYFIRKEHLALRNNFRVTKKFNMTKFDCTRNKPSFFFSVLFNKV